MSAHLDLFDESICVNIKCCDYKKCFGNETILDTASISINEERNRLNFRLVVKTIFCSSFVGPVKYFPTLSFFSYPLKEPPRCAKEMFIKSTETQTVTGVFDLLFSKTFLMSPNFFV